MFTVNFVQFQGYHFFSENLGKWGKCKNMQTKLSKLIV